MQDSLGLVVFDDSVDVVLPAGPLSDKARAHAAIDTVRDGGSTNLSGGLLRGLQEARRAAGPAGATLLLLSDGHANSGVTDPDQLRSVCASARKQGMTVSAVGIGLGYDEQLLGAVAEGGGGDLVFAESADGAAKAVASQVEGLLSQVAQAVSLSVTMEPTVRGVHLHNDLPAQVVDHALLIELGEFYADERRRVLLTFDVPALAALGLATVAHLRLTWVELPGLVQHDVDLPVQVNVVPGDEAAGRTVHPAVSAEKLVLDAARARRSASDRLSRGDRTGALRSLSAASASLHAGLTGATADVAEDLLVQAAQLDALLDDVSSGHEARAAKSARTQYSMTTRKRGRWPPGSPR